MYVPFIRFFVKDLVAKADQRKDCNDLESQEAYDNLNNQGTVGSYARVVLWPPTCLSNGSIGIVRAYRHLLSSPASKFLLQGVYHTLFLLLFSYMMLTSFSTTSGYEEEIQCVEYTVIGWCLFMTLNDILQVCRVRSIQGYFWHDSRSFWNILDAFSNVVVAVVVIIRRDRRGNFDQRSAVVVYAFLLVVCYIRYMGYFVLWKTVGQKILMIRQMLSDLSFFLYIFAVFVFGFGIPMQALLHPDSGFSAKSIIQALYAPYFNIFGELFIERTEGKLLHGEPCAENITEHDQEPSVALCPVKHWSVTSFFAVYMILMNVLIVNLLIAVFGTLNGFGNTTTSVLFKKPTTVKHWSVTFFFAVYMILMNVLIVNLLIAVFGNTFNRVHKNAERVWQYHYFGLVQEAYYLPFGPPPFNIIFLIAMGIRKRFWDTNDLNQLKERATFSHAPTELRNAQLDNFEGKGRRRYLLESDDKEPLKDVMLKDPEKEIINNNKEWKVMTKQANEANLS